jgi:hypothetical protein
MKLMAEALRYCWEHSENLDGECDTITEALAEYAKLEEVK